MNQESSTHQNQINNLNNTQEITLNAKPVSITRQTTLNTKLGIPIIHDVIIIETEASISRIIHHLILILIFCIILQTILIFFEKINREKTVKFKNFLILIFPLLGALFFGKFVFVFLWIMFNFIFFMMIRSIIHSIDWNNEDIENINVNESEYDNLNILENKENLENNIKNNNNIKNDNFFKIISNNLKIFFRKLFFKKFKIININNFYLIYTSIFKISNFIITFSIFFMGISILIDNFKFLNISLIFFIYNLYFLVIFKILVENVKMEIFKKNEVHKIESCLCGENCKNNFELENEFTNNKLELENENEFKNNKLELEKNYKKLNFYRINDSINKKTEKKIKLEKKIILPCSHNFHSNCILGYYLLSQSLKCPFCFEKYSKDLLEIKFLFYFNNFMELMRRVIVFSVVGVFLVFWYYK